jgi:16S rRNA processing protein RimM
MTTQPTQDPPISAQASAQASAQQDDWLEIGRIVSPQGLHGELRVYPNTDFPERFLVPGERWLLPAGRSLPRHVPQPVQLVAGRVIPKRGLFVIRLAGVEDREAAEALRNAQLLVPASDRPPLEPGEFHVLDLVGLTVVDQATQAVVGRVESLIPTGQDLLEIRLDATGTCTLLPFVEAIVPVVDLATGRLEITPPPGLLDLPHPQPGQPSPTKTSRTKTSRTKTSRTRTSRTRTSRTKTSHAKIPDTPASDTPASDTPASDTPASDTQSQPAPPQLPPLPNA